MEEALMKRILPHSTEAEQSVIGSMIMSRGRHHRSLRDHYRGGFLSAAVRDSF